ncbi:MAG: rhodanese-like domain-containing protein, partial [Casimicrobium sp.]
TLASAIEAGRAVSLLDVREPWEFAHAQIAGSINIPMSTIATQLDAIRKLQGDNELVLICHHGARSMHVAQFLANQGFDELVNLRGGIDAWSTQVDATVPVY